MEPLDVLTAQDLRQRPDDLLRDAGAGRLALVTEQGRPAHVAVPFDERLLSLGVHRSLALHLFEGGQLTLSQAAMLADLTLDALLDLLGKAGIAAVDYPPEEIARDLKHAL